MTRLAKRLPEPNWRTARPVRLLRVMGLGYLRRPLILRPCHCPRGSRPVLILSSLVQLSSRLTFPLAFAACPKPNDSSTRNCSGQTVCDAETHTCVRATDGNCPRDCINNDGMPSNAFCDTGFVCEAATG